MSHGRTPSGLARLFALLLALGAVACSSTESQLQQALLEVPMNYDETFDASLGIALDEGYALRVVDRSNGVITGSQQEFGSSLGISLFAGFVPIFHFVEQSRTTTFTARLHRHGPDSTKLRIVRDQYLGEDGFEIDPERFLARMKEHARGGS